MDASQWKDFAARYTEAWCSQHAEAVGSFFSPDGSLQINNQPPAIGTQAITLAAQEFMTAFPDLVVRMDGLDVLENGAVYQWTLTGTNTGPGGTGNAVSISGYEQWKPGRDGLIAESLGHFDAAEYQRQLKPNDTSPG